MGSKLAKLQPPHLLSFYNNLAENGMRLDYKYLLNKEFYHLVNTESIINISDKRTRDRLLAGKQTDKLMATKISNTLNISFDKLFKSVDIQKGLSAKTISNHHGLISSILTSAVQWQIITSNPCDRVKPPKRTRYEASHYDDEQTATLLHLLENEPLQYKVFVYLAIFTGARLGELSALSWTDIDFEKQTVKISKSLQYIPSVGAFEKEPKTKQSNRLLYLCDTMIKLLKTHEYNQIEERLKCGSLWQNHNKIFTRWNGEFISPSTMTEWFRNFLRKNGLPHLTFHQLRHTNATLMISEGVDLATVSKLLGHSQVSTTSNIYIHSTFAPKIAPQSAYNRDL